MTMIQDIPAHPDARPDTSTLLPLSEYDRIVLMFSGGKDSTAMLVHVLDRMREAGIPRSRLELWHQLVDGSPETASFMDWPVTHAYCVAVAKALDVPIRFQWREGGFLREMMRDGTPTAPVTVEGPSGDRKTAGGRGPAGTRLKFPQVSGDLSVRWCSAYLKIDVAARAISADPRMAYGTVLVLTGERREESGGRARYATVERHRTSSGRRRVDHFRVILGWSEVRVWETLRAAGIEPHPCYRAGYGRASCSKCIFGRESEWATARHIDPAGFTRIADHEQGSGKTIDRKRSVIEMADRGEPLAPLAVLDQWGPILQATTYDLPVLVDPSAWVLPIGAFRQGGGPT